MTENALDEKGTRKTPWKLTGIPHAGKLLQVFVHSSDLFWVFLAAVFPLLIYLRTLAPTVYGLDSAELTTGAYVLGIVHAPGSPLYLLLGHLFTYLPVGDVGYRLNLMSAVVAGGTAVFFFQLLYRLTQHRLVALSATWLLAFSYYFWTVSLVAELYALQAFFVILLLWLAWQWHQQKQPWQLYSFAFLFGLGLGNHLSLVLLIPGFALLLVVRQPSLTARSPLTIDYSQLTTFLKSLPFVLLGASIYLYLPWRHLSDTPMNYARDYWHLNLASWDGFWWMVTGRMFGSLFWGVPGDELLAEFTTYLSQLWGNFMGLGFLLGIVGLVADWRKRPILHLALLLMSLTHLGFFITYRVADKDMMFLPTYVIWAIWIGIGAAFIGQQIQERTVADYHLLSPTLLLLLPLTSLVVNYHYADLSQDWSARQEGETIFAGLPDEAIFLGSWRDVPILEYLQLVEGQRPDVQLTNLVFIGREGGQRIAEERLKAGSLVYTSRAYLDNENLDLMFQDNCHCYQVILAP